MTTTPWQRLEAAKRELGLRHTCYPRWVQSGKMTQEKADYEIAVQTDIVAILRLLVPTEMEMLQEDDHGQ